MKCVIQFPRFCIPDYDGFVFSASGYKLTILRECNCIYQGRMSHNSLGVDLISFCDPDLHTSIIRCAGNQFPIFAKTYATHTVTMSLKYLIQLSRFNIPKSHCFVIRAAHEVLSIGREAQAVHAVVVLLDNVNGRAVLSVPNANYLVS